MTKKLPENGTGVYNNEKCRKRKIQKFSCCGFMRFVFERAQKGVVLVKSKNSVWYTGPMKNIKFTGLEDAVFREKIKLYHREFLIRMEAWVIKPSFRKTVKVHICDRMKSYGGWAYWYEMSMKLNYWMLYKSDDDLRQTYGHELAHLITHSLYRRRGYRPKPHGDEWKHVMKNLGLVPHRCHRFGPNEREKMKKDYREEKHGRKNQTQQKDVVPAATQP